MAIPWCLTRHWPVTACWRSPRLYRVLAPDSEPTPFPVFAHYSHRCFDVSSKPLVEPPITSRPLWHLPGRKDRVRHQNPLGPGPRGVHHRAGVGLVRDPMDSGGARSEEHTSELQSLMRISYAVFCLKKQTNTN